MTFDGRLAASRTLRFLAKVVGMRPFSTLLEKDRARAALGRLPGLRIADLELCRPLIEARCSARRWFVIFFEFLGGQPFRRQRQLVTPEVRRCFGLWVAVPHDESEDSKVETTMSR